MTQLKTVGVFALIALTGVMVSSASALDLNASLTNVSFETGDLTGWTNPTGGGVVGDGTPGPAWGDGLLAMDGTYWAGVQEGGAQNPKYIEQSIAVTPGEMVTLNGWMAGGAWNDQDLVVQILNADASILDEMRVPMPGNPAAGFPFVPLTSGTINPANLGSVAGGGLSGLATGNSVTVRVGWDKSTGNWSNGTAAYFDAAVPEPASLGLMLLGLPLLIGVRRRKAS